MSEYFNFGYRSNISNMIIKIINFGFILKGDQDLNQKQTEKVIDNNYKLKKTRGTEGVDITELIYKCE